jgi:hypothetical protein
MRAGSCTLRAMLGGSAGTLRIAALVGAVVVAGACGGDDGDDGSADTTAATTTSAPPTTLDDETQKEEAATTALLDYYDAYQEATAEPVDPQNAELQALITGEHKVVVTRNLQERQAKGEAVKLPANSQSSHDIRSAELRPDGTVEIIDCQVDDSIVYEVATGNVVDDDVVTKLVIGSMAQEDGDWKVAFAEISEAWPGVRACDG